MQDAFKVAKDSKTRTDTAMGVPLSDVMSHMKNLSFNTTLF